MVRAMAIVPRALRRPLTASLAIAAPTGFWRMPASKPPP
jgi:hypothetical protein